ncbi:preprotein translocase subunit YajC [Terrabacter sp. MAHUQ-38]|uniref:preprotein translocase subunit YajC n=1 Tax=unclassified Terrabacter TaxID=2630222 RepID=UPI00165E37E6|nr:preprotein translocase subunit YajC [Terrabacter sp. MAHUQ-38]MBC9823516.1 preprotein translocase subunit YajC [Terrabacter sp. MAHUQ-38]
MNTNGTFSLLIFALPLLLLGWLFFSQNKRMKQVREFSSALNVGDQVITSSGVYGTIKHLDDSSAWLEVAEGTTIRFDRRAVAMKQTDTPAAGPTTSTDTSADASADDAPGATPGTPQNGQ